MFFRRARYPCFTGIHLTDFPFLYRAAGNILTNDGPAKLHLLARPIPAVSSKNASSSRHAWNLFAKRFIQRILLLIRKIYTRREQTLIARRVPLAAVVSSGNILLDFGNVAAAAAVRSLRFLSRSLPIISMSRIPISCNILAIPLSVACM